MYYMNNNTTTYIINININTRQHNKTNKIRRRKEIDGATMDTARRARRDEFDYATMRTILPREEIEGAR